MSARMTAIIVTGFIACGSIVMWRMTHAVRDPGEVSMAELYHVTGCFTGNDGRLHDDVEQSAAFQEAEPAVDKQVNAEREAESVSGMGTAHFLWQRKKALLKEGYGIDWRTPAEMNPWRIFD